MVLAQDNDSLGGSGGGGGLIGFIEVSKNNNADNDVYFEGAGLIYGKRNFPTILFVLMFTTKTHKNMINGEEEGVDNLSNTGGGFNERGSS